jgi:hypothetical protein
MTTPKPSAQLGLLLSLLVVAAASCVVSVPVDCTSYAAAVRAICEPVLGDIYFECYGTERRHGEGVQRQLLREKEGLLLQSGEPLLAFMQHAEMPVAPIFRRST